MLEFLLLCQLSSPFPPLWLGFLRSHGTWCPSNGFLPKWPSKAKPAGPWKMKMPTYSYWKIDILSEPSGWRECRGQALARKWPCRRNVQQWASQCPQQRSRSREIREREEGKYVEEWAKSLFHQQIHFYPKTMPG